MPFGAVGAWAAWAAFTYSKKHSCRQIDSDTERLQKFECTEQDHKRHNIGYETKWKPTKMLRAKQSGDWIGRKKELLVGMYSNRKCEKLCRKSWYTLCAFHVFPCWLSFTTCRIVFVCVCLCVCLMDVPENVLKNWKKCPVQEIHG